MRWEELRLDEKRLDEMRRAQMRWDEDEVWSLKCAVSSATFGTQCVAWCCIAPWMCAGHVRQQQRSRFAKSMHAQAWVAQGACKFYWYLKNFKVIRNPLQKPEIWTCFCLGLVGLAQGNWKETSNGSTVIDDCAFANWNPCGVKDFSWFCTKPGYMTEVHFILAVSTVLQRTTLQKLWLRQGQCINHGPFTKAGKRCCVRMENWTTLNPLTNTQWWREPDPMLRHYIWTNRQRLKAPILLSRPPGKPRGSSWSI